MFGGKDNHVLGYYLLLFVEYFDCVSVVCCFKDLLGGVYGHSFDYPFNCIV